MLPVCGGARWHWLMEQPKRQATPQSAIGGKFLWRDANPGSPPSKRVSLSNHRRGNAHEGHAQSGAVAPTRSRLPDREGGFFCPESESDGVC